VLDVARQHQISDHRLPMPAREPPWLAIGPVVRHICLGLNVQNLPIAYENHAIVLEPPIDDWRSYGDEHIVIWASRGELKHLANDLPAVLDSV
jgi:hypothetical protein